MQEALPIENEGGVKWKKSEKKNRRTRASRHPSEMTDLDQSDDEKVRCAADVPGSQRLGGPPACVTLPMQGRGRVVASGASSGMGELICSQS